MHITTKCTNKVHDSVQIRKFIFAFLGTIIVIGNNMKAFDIAMEFSALHEPLLSSKYSS